MFTLWLPAFAMTYALSARQLPAAPPAATTRPAGRVSLSAMLISGVLGFGLAMLKVSDVVPFRAKLATPKALEAVGGLTMGAAETVSVAVLLIAPGPLSLAEIGPVVL